MRPNRYPSPGPGRTSTRSTWRRVRDDEFAPGVRRRPVIIFGGLVGVIVLTLAAGIVGVFQTDHVFTDYESLVDENEVLLHDVYEVNAALRE
jgi:hypothetical protein